MEATDKHITPEYIDVGVWIYFDRKAAEYLNTIYKHVSQERYKAEPGFHFVTMIDDSYVNPPGMTRQGTVAMTFYAHHHEWKGEDDKEDIPITINPDGAVILPGEIILSDMIYQVGSAPMKLAELTKANESRYTCIRCANDLNIVSNNVRICNPCETELE